MADPSVIQTEKLSCSFDHLMAVNNLSFEVKRGEIFGLVGPDGSGKTTTIRLLTTLLNPTGGKASILGLDSVKDAEAIKEKIGYMSQRFGLYPDLTVEENIHFYADIYGLSSSQKLSKTSELLEFARLTPFKERFAQHLSGGMKQKLGLACALVHQPEILFLDEPTNGVDPLSRRDFWQILYQLLEQQVTIFLSTTYLEEVERCKRIAMIYQGELIALGTPQELKNKFNSFVLVVPCEKVREATIVVQKELGSQNVRPWGKTLHVLAKEKEEASQKVIQALKKNWISHGVITTTEPTLEDVFISLVERLS